MVVNNSFIHSTNLLENYYLYHSSYEFNFVLVVKTCVVLRQHYFGSRVTSRPLRVSLVVGCDPSEHFVGVCTQATLYRIARVELV